MLLAVEAKVRCKPPSGYERPPRVVENHLEWIPTLVLLPQNALLDSNHLSVEGGLLAVNANVKANTIYGKMTTKPATDRIVHLSMVHGLNVVSACHKTMLRDGSNKGA